MTPKRKIWFEDNRSKKIVYISHCLLNQNCRYPGIATSDGIIVEILEPLLRKGIGIEQLPCLECMEWGGVSRNSILKFLPIIRKYSYSKLSPFIKLFSKIWYWNYKRLCKREAKKVANQIKDHLNSGYTILGLISMNDSPTCGVTKTLDLLGSIFKYRELEIDLEDFEHPKLEKMRNLIPKLLVDGEGTFMHELVAKLKKLKQDIKIIGFNPWDNLDEEVNKIKNQIFTNEAI